MRRKMKACIRAAQGSGSAVALLLKLTALVLVLSLARPSAAAPKLVPPEALGSLLLGIDELPQPAVLCFLRNAAPGWARSGWVGPPLRKVGALTRAEYSFDFEVRILGSPKEAAAAAETKAHSFSAVFAEVSAQQPFASFADLAWLLHGEGPGAVVLARGNVCAHINLGRRTGDPRDTLKALASRIGARIDAARAGRPLPPAVLPPSVEDLGLDNESAWAEQAPSNLLRPTGSLLLVQNGQALPRAIAAQRISSQNYLVPLASLAAVLGSRVRPAQQGGEVRLTLAGKSVVLTKDSSRVLVDGRASRLASPVCVRSGRTMVPISLLEAGFGRKLRWRRSGGLTIVQVTPAILNTEAAPGTGDGDTSG